MPKKVIRSRTFRIYRRADGRFEVRNEFPNDSPLGVDATLTMAIGSAAREAMLASREGCRVVIEAQQPDKTWKRVDVINPPISRG